MQPFEVQEYRDRVARTKRNMEETGVDVLLVAPKGSGTSVRRNFLSGAGINSSFAIEQDGKISGAFTNGLTRTLGQIAMARFTNPGGLVDVGSNSFRVGPNSGEPLLTAPLDFGSGRLIGGALELSNVDLSQEFINMILASTGYSAASRVITTTDELIDQLLLLGR